MIDKRRSFITITKSKSNIKDLFNDLLDESKYQLTIKILLKKYKDSQTEFSPVFFFFNSATTIVVNHKFDLEKTFQEILYSIERWVNEGSGWIIEEI